MKSCLYAGHVQHRRHVPRPNRFRYRIYMMLIDLDELPALFDGCWFGSAHRAAPVRFRRADFHGDPFQPLDVAVRDTVEAHCGVRPAGPIRLLAHLRHFGYSFNPVSFYYVYDASGAHVETILAEITNTPWNERHVYVLPVSRAQSACARHWRWRFDKTFHVSPFFPMDMQYDWRLSAPDRSLRVHMENWRDGAAEFDATLTLQRRPLSGGNLLRALLEFPLITVRVIALIYWQALKLWLKRTPFYSHPQAPGRQA